VTAARPSVDIVADLLAESLRAWAVPGSVTPEAAACLRINANGATLRIRRADAGTPLRWMVESGERTRGVTSVAGLLRAVRSALDPGYRTVRLRIAPAPLVPP